MKRFAAGLLLLLPLAGCQDNASLEREVSSLKIQMAELKSAGDIPAEQTAQPAVLPSDVDGLRLRLERAEGELSAARKRIEQLEARPDVPPPAAVDGKTDDQAQSEAAYKSYLEFEARKRAEDEAARKKAEAERYATWEQMAKENGIDFDANDPEGSIRRIMRNPEQRAKAMELYRAEQDKRRFANVGLDERQIEQVKKIETEGRDKYMQALQGAVAGGGGREEVAKQMEQINKDQEAELKQVMTEEQYKKYQENGGALAGMMGGLGDAIPGLGNIPGMGGRRGGNR